jgi:hypothetical protein
MQTPAHTGLRVKVHGGGKLPSPVRSIVALSHLSAHPFFDLQAIVPPRRNAGNVGSMKSCGLSQAATRYVFRAGQSGHVARQRRRAVSDIGRRRAPDSRRERRWLILAHARELIARRKETAAMPWL